MTEAVIVATARSPIGRANKGSLVSLRPDDMSAQILQALLAKAPQVQASDINDLMWGIGQPAGEGGFNIARVISSLAGLDDVPGADGCRDGRGRMAEHCACVTEAEIDVFVTVDVFEAGAARIGDEERKRRRPVGHPVHGHAAEERLLRLGR